jgi:hypothetical protein
MALLREQNLSYKALLVHKLCLKVLAEQASKTIKELDVEIARIDKLAKQPAQTFAEFMKETAPYFFELNKSAESICKAIEDHKEGVLIINMPPSSGKTTLAKYYTKYMNGDCLFIHQDLELLREQFRKEIGFDYTSTSPQKAKIIMVDPCSEKDFNSELVSTIARLCPNTPMIVLESLGFAKAYKAGNEKMYAAKFFKWNNIPTKQISYSVSDCFSEVEGVFALKNFASFPSNVDIYEWYKQKMRIN